VAGIELRLDPAALANPDADLRYVLPDLVCARSGDTVHSDGYDYEGDAPVLAIFLVADDPPAAVALVAEVLASGPILGNDLVGKVRVTIVA